MSDKVMSQAVKMVLRESFLKSSGTQDVQTLASERMAINLLEEGFKELKKFSNTTEQKFKELGNVGL